MLRASDRSFGPLTNIFSGIPHHHRIKLFEINRCIADHDGTPSPLGQGPILRSQHMQSNNSIPGRSLSNFFRLQGAAMPSLFSSYRQDMHLLLDLMKPQKQQTVATVYGHLVAKSDFLVANFTILARLVHFQTLTSDDTGLFQTDGNH